MKTELLCLKKALEGAHPIARSLLWGLWSPLLYINSDFLIKIKFRNTVGFPWKGNLQMKKHSLLSFSVSASFMCMCVCSVTQAWLLHDPMDPSPPGSSVNGIILVRILEWVAISFSRGSSPSRDQTYVSGKPSHLHDVLLLSHWPWAPLHRHKAGIFCYWAPRSYTYRLWVQEG